MMAELLGTLFPPRLGKIENHGPSVTLHLIDTGAVKVIEMDHSWAGNTKIWQDGRWQRAPIETAVGWKTTKHEGSIFSTILS